MDKKTNEVKKLLDLPKYENSSKNNKFYKCPVRSDLKIDSLYITPFDYYISYANIFNILILLFQLNQTLNLKKLCFNIKEKMIIKFIYAEKIDSNLIGIISIFNDDIWYPIDEFEKK